MKSELKNATVLTIEIQRFVVFFMMCYYYIDKASGLLKDKYRKKKKLKVVLGSCLASFLILTVVSSAGIINNIMCEKTGKAYKLQICLRKLCAHWIF